MPRQRHLELLKQGKAVWNAWRERHRRTTPNLSHADLREADLRNTFLTEADFTEADLRGADLSEAYLFAAFLCEADLSRANLSRANLTRADLTQANLWRANLREATLSIAELSEANVSEANLSRANLTGADLEDADLRGANLARANVSEANLSRANLRDADLTGADLRDADLRDADLSRADLEDADLRGANLTETDFTKANLRGAYLNSAILVKTKLHDADLTGCYIHGISAWNIQLMNTVQSNLIITDFSEPTITVDNLEVAQFIYLLLNNSKIRDVIDTIAKKAVLILGRFTSERKAVLDALRDALRVHGYLPILFDFEKPASRDITETISTLAHLARFVIADITEPKSIPQELSQIVPFLPSVPIVPLLQVSEREYGMYEHFISYPWVQPIYHYHDLDELLQSIQEHVIEPAERKARELVVEKAKRLEIL